jgi:hypothetical protein
MSTVTLYGGPLDGTDIELDHEPHGGTCALILMPEDVALYRWDENEERMAFVESVSKKSIAAAPERVPLPWYVPLAISLACASLLTQLLNLWIGGQR